MNSTEISIIVPVYNGGQYLDHLFSQFEGQPMDAVELVCVDDGSRDDSLQILRRWQEKAGFRISVYHQENRGVSAARNLGVEKARGRYIAFLDADDAVALNYIAALRDYARQAADVTVFASRRVREGFSREYAPPAPVVHLTGAEQLRRFWADPTRLGMVNLLVRKAYLEEKQITAPVGYRYYEDYDFLLQIFAQTGQICVTEQVLYYYIMRSGSAMSRFTADRINCLGLIRDRAAWLKTAVPEFAPDFARWGTSRLYWSVLWQAALALESYAAFAEFAELTFAKQYLKKLNQFPDRLVRLSSAVFLICKPAYYGAVRLTGRIKSSVYPAELDDIRHHLAQNRAFY